MIALRDFSQIWSLVGAAVIFILLFQSKYPPRKTRLIIFSIVAILLPTALAIYSFVGPEHIMGVTLMTATIPSLILFYLLSEYRDGRFFFTFCLSDTVCIWLMQLTNLLDRACGGTYIVLFVSRLVLFLLLWLLLRTKLRRPYLELQANLPGGWWMITAISAGFYLLLLTVSIPIDVPLEQHALVQLLVVIVLMPVTYLAILGSLRRQMLYYEARNREDLLQTQISGLRGRMDATRAAEETIRIERHDLRHKLLTVEDMLRRSGTEEALSYIRTLRGEVEYTNPERWCADPLLDTVFSSYFAQARRQGIEVKATLAFPDKLPVDSAELSTVFSNALENAIRVCSTLPRERREIVCTCISQPCLMFEIANPCGDDVHFDKAGLPVAREPGHGIGTRSIAAFCEKHNACCVYEAKDGWFYLKIAL